MDMNEVIAQITWTVYDVKTAFVDKHGREPSEAELSDCVQNVNERALHDCSIEYGWDFINDAII